MVGNLVDNACKWAQSRVSVEVIPEARRRDAQLCASSSMTTARA